MTNKKYISFFIIAVFLVSQAFAFLHAAEGHDDHGQQDCEICFNANCQKLLKVTFKNPIISDLLVFNTSSLDQFFIFSFQSKSFKSRAPPILS